MKRNSNMHFQIMLDMCGHYPIKFVVFFWLNWYIVDANLKRFPSAKCSNFRGSAAPRPTRHNDWGGNLLFVQTTTVGHQGWVDSKHLVATPVSDRLQRAAAAHLSRHELEPRPEQNQQGRTPRWNVLLSPVESSSPLGTSSAVLRRSFLCVWHGDGS